MAAVVWVSLVFVLIASPHTASTAPLSTPTPKPPCRVSRDIGTGTGKPRFRPSFGPPVQSHAGTTYPVQYSTGTEYPVPAYADSTYPAYPPYPVQREQSTSYGQNGDHFEQTVDFETPLSSYDVQEQHGVHRFTQGFGSAWSGPPLPPPLAVLPPPPPPSQGREFHSVVNYGSISIHHGAHFEPHHNEKEPPGGTAAVDVLPIKSVQPRKEPETIAEKTRKLMVSADVKKAEVEETEVEVITASSAEKI